MSSAELDFVIFKDVSDDLYSNLHMSCATPLLGAKPGRMTTVRGPGKSSKIEECTGQLLQIRIPFSRYSSQTRPGFSGAPVMVGKNPIGIHIEAGDGKTYNKMLSFVLVATIIDSVLKKESDMYYNAKYDRHVRKMEDLMRRAEEEQERREREEEEDPRHQQDDSDSYNDYDDAWGNQDDDEAYIKHQQSRRDMDSRKPKNSIKLMRVEVRGDESDEEVYVASFEDSYTVATHEQLADEASEHAGDSAWADIKDFINKPTYLGSLDSIRVFPRPVQAGVVPPRDKTGWLTVRARKGGNKESDTVETQALDKDKIIADLEAQVASLREKVEIWEHLNRKILSVTETEVNQDSVKEADEKDETDTSTAQTSADGQLKDRAQPTKRKRKKKKKKSTSEPAETQPKGLETTAEA